MSRLGDFLDAVIEPFAPAAAARRRAVRIGASHLRQYDAAQRDRRTAGWRSSATSADREIGRSLGALRDAARDLDRNNKYAHAMVEQMTAHMIGDGITARAVHDDKKIAGKAQDEWDNWSSGKVHEGVNNHYHVQKLIGRGLIVGGEMLQVWRPENDMPDATVDVLEGDYIDSGKTALTNGGRIVQGVEFAARKRIGYWLYDNHPGDGVLSALGTSAFTASVDVDHVFKQDRAPQARGVSWFGALALTFHDIADVEDAALLKKKIENCVGLVLTGPADGSGASPLDPNAKAQNQGDYRQERITPGMIFRGKAGETATVINPTATLDTVTFIRQQLAGISASMVPYHLMTGDVSQANYSSLRAALLGFWALLDDWQQQIIIPRVCDSAFRRRMRVLAIKAGDNRFLAVKPQWAVPNRGFVDPVKDLMGEILAIRAGLVNLFDALAKRGIDGEKQLAAIAQIDALIDKFGLALDTDPRRLTSAGILQAAAGYIKPQDNSATN